MAKKELLKSNGSKRSNLVLSKKQVTLIALAVLGFLSFFTYVIVDNIANNRKISNLTRASGDLDRLQEAIRPKLTTSEVTRLSKCSRTTEKYGNGWIICGQYLKITGSSNSDSQIAEVVDLVSAEVSRLGNFRKINPEVLLDYSKMGRALTGVSLSVDSTTYPLCGIGLDAYKNNYPGSEDRGTYELTVRCTESHLHEEIY